MKQQNARGQWGGGFPQAGLRRVGQLERTGQASWLDADGTVLEIAAYPAAQGRSVLRLRLGHTQGADYGLLPGLGEAQALEVGESENGWQIAVNDIVLGLERDPARITLSYRGRVRLCSIVDEHFRGWSRLPAFAQGALRQLAAFELGPEEAVYGLGEKFGAVNRRGQLIIGRNEDALGVNAERSYKNIPFAWSPQGWGLLVHTPAPVVHGVGFAPWSQRAYVLEAEDDALDLFFFAADEPAAILADYVALTGYPADVPRWSLGTWVSRAYYRTPQEALEVAQEWRRRGLPGDVLTLDGRACWEVATRFSFIWDETRFPDPARSLAELRATGFHLCVWEYPLVSVDGPLFADFAARGWLLRDASGNAYRYEWISPDPEEKSPFGAVLTPLPVSGIVDLTHPEAYAWWRDRHAELFAIGVDVLKADFGEQVPDDAFAHNGDSGQRLHNVYALLYHRCVYEATQLGRPGEALIWARDGFIGSQRYPIQWGGDPQSDWGGLAASVRSMLGYGLSGVPYYSSDVGGFYGSRQPDAELYLRWLAHGVFSSHLRLHGIGAREPWLIEPSALVPDVCAVAAEWLRLRYRLLPYLQAVIREATRTGLPVARAMALAFPQDRVAQEFELQYLFGPTLLVRPVVEQGARASIWLPQGEEWFDVWTGQHYTGGQLIEVLSGLDRIPLFGRAGHALALGPAATSIDALSDDALPEEVWCFGDRITTVLGLPDGLALHDLPAQVLRRHFHAGRGDHAD